MIYEHVIKFELCNFADHHFLYLVSPETESKTFNDDFFTQQDIVVNALDNIEARRYMDGY